jgi:hypothetical protein
MSSHPTDAPAGPEIGARLVALAGIGLVGYGVMFLIRNFTTFIELGLTPEHVGGTPEQIRAFSPHLFHYISHLQVALAAFIIAFGMAVIALAWFGIRTGARWALGTTFFASVVAIVLALPLHYAYGLATLGHLGPLYLDVAVLLSGIVLARRARELSS